MLIRRRHRRTTQALALTLVGALIALLSACLPPRYNPHNGFHSRANEACRDNSQATWPDCLPVTV